MNQHHSLSTCTWDALKVNANQTNILWNSTKTCSNHVILLKQLNNYQDEANIQPKTEALSCYMEENAEKMWKDIANWQIKKAEQLYKLSSPCFDDHHIKKRNLNQLENCHKYAHKLFKCLYLARIGRSDILWPVNKLSRSVNKSTQARDRRLARFISHTHHTRDYRQRCHEGNAAQHCRSSLFQDSDFVGVLEVSKSTS